MTNAIQPNQNLSSILAYNHALKNVDTVEKAIHLTENGKKIANLPQYIQAYATLASQIVERNNQGPIAKPLLASHLRLTNKLLSLEKRVAAIVEKSGVQKNLLKSQQNIARSLSNLVVGKMSDLVSTPWTLRRTAKWTATGGIIALAIAKGPSNLAHTAYTTTSAAWTIFKDLPEIAKRITEILKGGATAGKNIVEVVKEAEQYLPEGSGQIIGGSIVYYLTSSFLANTFFSISKNKLSSQMAFLFTGAHIACSTYPKECEELVQFVKANPKESVAGGFALGALLTRIYNFFYNIMPSAPRTLQNWIDQDVQQIAAGMIPAHQEDLRMAIIAQHGPSQLQRANEAQSTYNKNLGTYQAMGNWPSTLSMVSAANLVAPAVYNCVTDPHCREAVYDLTKAHPIQSSLGAITMGIATGVSALKTKQMWRAAITLGAVGQALLIAGAGTALTLSGGIAASGVGAYCLYNSWHDGYLGQAANGLSNGWLGHGADLISAHP